MTEPNPEADSLVRTATLLSYRWTTRIITELDDNGPVARRRGSLAATFSDIPVDVLKTAVAGLRRRGLVRRETLTTGEQQLTLTEPGLALGDVYDRLGRWARQHDYPDDQPDFVTRVEAALGLLRDPHTVTFLLNPHAPYEASRVARAVDAGLVRQGAHVPWILTDAGRDLQGPLAEVQGWATANTALVQRVRHARPAPPVSRVRAAVPGVVLGAALPGAAPRRSA
ncbi:winged helix-turn-helix transcriptional regulator [Streptomyces sp. NBC_01264]|uniref:winged helix-turn-helix transcriptional regulator n=1 Tax=Streptomyces sp. NBC_01264 TaxID=2903804 RepID=UPI00225B621E|nr:winged helix-turn-helix transcriptional regulator [Streptomyces sp. NBC_01264]MCX4776850.1 winged helix-turn-helix transcriptional regulator [Streptomyces sp. NBC_01264]